MKMSETRKIFGYMDIMAEAGIMNVREYGLFSIWMDKYTYEECIIMLDTMIEGVPFDDIFA